LNEQRVNDALFIRPSHISARANVTTSRWLLMCILVPALTASTRFLPVVHVAPTGPRFATATPVAACETIKNANHLTEFLED